MKTSLITACCLLSIIAGASFIHSLNSTVTSNMLRQQMRAQASDDQSKFDALAETESNEEQAVTMLQSNLTQLRWDSQEYASKLDMANQRLAAYQSLDRQHTANEAADEQLVPKPSIDGDGICTFQKVVGIDGETLMTDATFTALGGNHLLVFMGKDGVSHGFEMDNVHPLILKYLHIDPVAVRQNRMAIDRQGRLATESTGIKTAIATQASEAQQRFEAQIAVQQQAAAAQQATADAAAQQAEADKEQAAAMILNAQRPATQVNVIQQQSQQQSVNPNTGVMWSH